MNKTVFATFVYPGSEMHLPRMFSSLNKQSDHDFDVAIFNDGAKHLEKICEKFLIKSPKIRPVRGSIPKIRATGLTQLKNSSSQRFAARIQTTRQGLQSVKSTFEHLITNQVWYFRRWRIDRFKNGLHHLVAERRIERMGYHTYTSNVYCLCVLPCITFGRGEMFQCKFHHRVVHFLCRFVTNGRCCDTFEQINHCLPLHWFLLEKSVCNFGLQI